MKEIARENLFKFKFRGYYIKKYIYLLIIAVYLFCIVQLVRLQWLDANGIPWLMAVLQSASQQNSGTKAETNT